MARRCRRDQCGHEALSPTARRCRRDQCGHSRLQPRAGVAQQDSVGSEGDSFEVIGALSAVHGAVEHEAYLDYLSRPEVAVVAITVTEAAYLRGTEAHFDAGLDVVVS